MKTSAKKFKYSTGLRLLGIVVKFFLITLLAGLMFIPFIWMVCTAFKSEFEATLPNIVPKAFQPENFLIVLRLMPDKLSGKMMDVNLIKWIFNSIFIASWVTTLQVITSSLAAFAFSRLHWRWRDKVFIMYLATMMIPGLVLTIPKYQIMVYFNLVDTYAGLILPMAFSAFGTFMLRQFMLGIPSSYDEAAEMDGANAWQIYMEVILPLTKPGLITLAIFTFLGNYRELMWPLIMVKDEALRTVPVGLLSFQSGYTTKTELLMAGTVICITPLIILFILLQKQLIKGVNIGGGVKG